MIADLDRLGLLGVATMVSFALIVSSVVVCVFCAAIKATKGSVAK